MNIEEMNNQIDDYNKKIADLVFDYDRWSVQMGEFLAHNCNARFAK